MFSVIVASSARGGEPSDRSAESAPLWRCEISRGTAQVLVPLRIAGREYLFILDTGCSRTVFDASLPLGRWAESHSVTTSGGDASAALFEAPEATVGDLSFRGPGVSTVVGADLRKFREVIGRPIMGLLGMDFLGRYAVRIDRDRGELLFLRSEPSDSGVPISMSWSECGIPTVEASVGGSSTIRFEIDTGNSGNDSGNIGGDDAQRLQKEGLVRVVGSCLSETYAGTVARPLLQAERLTLGPFRVDWPVLSQSEGSGGEIGVKFLSRFATTLDFPAGKLYLRKSTGYDRPDSWDRSGLHILSRDGHVVVHSVDAGRPGDVAGVRSGDILVSIGGRAADVRDLDDLRSLLCVTGRVECEFVRDNRVRRVTLKQGK